MNANHEMPVIQQVQKRNGELVVFDKTRIVNAIYKAMSAVGEGSEHAAKQVAESVYAELVEIKQHHKNFIPNVEGVQDAVEKALILAEFVQTAKAYILYREKRAQSRQQSPEITAHIKKLADENKQYFQQPLNQFVFLRTYARWIDDENRRETWRETVDRYMDFMRENLHDKLTESEYTEIYQAILQQQVMPSMRLMQFAGKAARSTHVCTYNCSYIAPNTLDDLGEIIYISMCGTGVGFSVESQNVQALPQIEIQTGEMLATYTIDDSKEGWRDALVLGLKTWYSGKDLHFDYSKLRPAGARIKTFGGRSSGPEPLRALLDYSRMKILQQQGRRLTNLNVHDIICKIGDVVVSGGVRRSAMISLSDLDDQALRDAKMGQFYFNEPQRSIANNSAVYLERPSQEIFMEEWLALMRSGTGERGIFNRMSLLKTLPKRRSDYFLKQGLINHERIVGLIGTNPCGEIILQSKQFCNLSEVIARATDNETVLLNKIRIATILGTYQATLTNFPNLSKAWRENCERERLLGVSISGHWDCAAVRDAQVLERLKAQAIKINQEYAARFQINPAMAITCVKPSGTVSQVVNCASGMHPRYAPYYVRRIRISAFDPLFRMLKDQGIPYHPEVGQTTAEASVFVLEFPVRAPEGAIVKDDLSALDQLEHWRQVKMHYTEHNPSVTISVGEEEWIAVANWLYSHWDIIGGLSFLPRDKHAYRLPPYEAITQEQYAEMLVKMAKINFAELITYEQSDQTDVKPEWACVGGSCDF